MNSSWQGKMTWLWLSCMLVVLLLQQQNLRVLTIVGKE
jgi:hypothetical protein